jgi:hypothetical protein
MKVIYIILLINLYAMHSYSQPSYLDTKYEPKELISDFDFLFKVYEDVHPNLYAYTSKESIQAECTAVKKSITHALTTKEFGLLIQPIISKLYQGHTWVNTYQNNYWDYFNKGGLIFPFKIKILNERMFVVSNFSSDSTIKNGSEIKKINNIEVSTIIDSLLQYEIGERKEFRIERLSKGFACQIWSIYNLGKEFNLEIILPGQDKVKHLFTKGVKGNSIRAEKSFSFYHKDSIGILDWESMQYDKGFKAFVNAMLDTLKETNTKSLIIDLRNNPGGDIRMGNFLLKRLTAQPFTPVSKMEIKGSNRLKKHYKNYIPKIIRWLPLQYLYYWTREMWQIPEGQIGTINIKTIKPKRKSQRYAGKVYVLIGPYTYSASKEFAIVIKENHIGALIGQETGGYVTDYLNTYFFKLPNTQLLAGVSITKSFPPNGKDEKHGVVPDYIVLQTIENYQKNIDAEMEYTLKLIKE